MLKRLSLYLLTAILTIATIGVDVSVQYCYGQYIGVQVNGFHFLTEEGKDMSCCQDDESGCDGCEHTHHQYQITLQYLGGQSVSTQPQLLTADGFNCFCEAMAQRLTITVDNSSQTDFYEPPPDYQSATLQRHGLRAPPMWA